MLWRAGVCGALGWDGGVIGFVDGVSVRTSALTTDHAVRLGGRAAARLRTSPWLVTAALGSVVVLIGRLGPDWPAQEFRGGLAHRVGLQAWDGQWYGGHALPGYSVLFPLIASLIGAGLTGLGSAIASAWLAPRLLPDARGRTAYGLVAAVWLLGNLLMGEVPFLLGLPFALGALLCVRHHQPVAAAILAAACSLSSPLTGLFLLLAAAAWWPDVGWRRSAPLAGAGCGLIVASLLGVSGGRFPFAWPGLLGIGIFTLLCWVCAPAALRPVRRFALIYAAAALVLFVVPNPVGGDFTRLGQLAALPLAAYVLVRHRRRVTALLIGLIAALAWQAIPVASAIARGANDPSSSPEYYAGLLSFLATRDPAAGRLEVPFTREHWEAAFVAPHFPLARGWERQLDLQYDQVLYHPLTAGAYRSWLDASAVDFVALPDVPLDYGAKAEAAVLARPPDYLQPVWHDAHWTVWRVIDARPLVTGAALTRLTTSSVELRFAAPGSAEVKVRASRLWHLDDSDACLGPTPDGWLQVRARSAGLVTIDASLTLAGVMGTAARCGTRNGA